MKKYNIHSFCGVEITHRLQSARPAVRQLLLRYLLPWLCNMELVDPNLPPFGSNFNYATSCSDIGRQTEGVNPGNNGNGGQNGSCIISSCLILLGSTIYVLNANFKSVVKDGDLLRLQKWY